MHIDDVSRRIEGDVNITVDKGNPAVMLFTSRTTGLPKAVRYLHEKMLHGALSIAHQLILYETPAKLTSSDVVFPQIPMYHILAWGTVFFAPYIGLKLVMGGRFDPASTVELIKKKRMRRG